jgi:hypothetical protein
VISDHDVFPACGASLILEQMQKCSRFDMENQRKQEKLFPVASGQRSDEARLAEI